MVEPMASRAGDLHYFNAARSDDYDQTAGLASVARVISAMVLVSGLILCVDFLRQHGSFNHGAYPWPWKADSLKAQLDLAAATLSDCAGPLLAGGAVAARKGARHGTRFLLAGVTLFLAAHLWRVAATVAFYIGKNRQPYGNAILAVVYFVSDVLFPAFLLCLLTRAGVTQQLAAEEIRRLTPIAEGPNDHAPNHVAPPQP